VHGGAQLLAGIVYQPYYLLTFVVACLVTWTCPQTWDWSRTITPPKAVAVAAAFVTAAVMLTTQAFNPFIYFIF
jgi:alginate O-acetyltransferase complex protein AlgI